MKMINMNIVLIIGSLFFILFGTLKLLDDSPLPEMSLEFENVIQANVDLNNTDLKTILSYFSSTFPENYPTNRWLFLFISAASQCGNCLNEINDYIELANEMTFFEQDFISVLFYHGEDSLQSRRYALTSDIFDIVDEASFIHTSELSTLNIGTLIPEYGITNTLYLADLEKGIVFHGFILPTIRTTMLRSKEIALRNAIQTYINNE